MKLASLKHGRDGKLLVVSRDLTRAQAVPDIAPTLQAALDDWAETAPRLLERSGALDAGRSAVSFPFNPADCAAPLPRAYQWADGSAYVVHVELVRKARGAMLPLSFWTDPLIYQGGSYNFIGPTDPICVAEGPGVSISDRSRGGADDVEMGVSLEAARNHIKLLMLANDVSLRNLIPGELAKGFRILPEQGVDIVFARRGHAR
jgi:fumarylacetoacetate (FAA) hydrolase